MEQKNNSKPIPKPGAFSMEIPKKPVKPKTNSIAKAGPAKPAKPKK
jgi:hypothetical protein